MILIGLIATGVMTLFLAVINWILSSDDSVLPVIGSVIAKQEKNARLIGFAIHIVLGVTFAFFYLWLAHVFRFETAKDFILFGAVIGLAHAVVVGSLLVVVAEHQLLQRFHKSGFRFYVAYAFAHVIYGLSGGIATAILKPDLSIFGG
jgi:hypothetical protein